MYDVIVIGAGPTGLAAGTQLALFSLKTLVLEAKEEAGGIAVRAAVWRITPVFLTKFREKNL